MDIKSELEKQKSQDPEFARTYNYIERKNNLIRKAKAIRVNKDITGRFS